MRIGLPFTTGAFLASLLLLNACGQKETTPAQADIPQVELTVSDSLTDISAEPNAIAFWTHPNVAFNSLLLVASKDGVVSYNMEDGNEVSRLSDINARGAAVGYLGVGQTARSLMVVFDSDASAFKIFEVDDATRGFQPVAGEISIEGAVNGFCLGRAQDATTPSLYVLGQSEMTEYEFQLNAGTITATATPPRPSPSDITACAVDNIDGAVFIARANGSIHRIPKDGSGALFAHADIENVRDISVLTTAVETDGISSVNGQIMLLDQTNGNLHVFDRSTGDALGIAQAKLLNEEGEAVDISGVGIMGATSTNLGGLYRNGAIAIGINSRSSQTPGTVHIIPANGLTNQLSLPSGNSLPPRGQPEENTDNSLMLDIEFQPTDP